MDCNEVRPKLIELADGALDDTTAAACRVHLDGCERCARELELERRAWRALGAIDHDEHGLGRERLERMAEAALAGAAATPAAAPSRRFVQLAAAAAVVLAVTLGARFALRRDDGTQPGPPLGPPPGPMVCAPSLLDDPEFVTNFDVICDLPDLVADGDCLDADDDVLALQALEGA